MKKIVILSLFLCNINLYSQSYNMIGTWEGKLYQSAGGASAEYNFTMELSQTGNFISGYSRINLYDRPDIFSKMDLVASLDGDHFLFQEGKILNQQILPEMIWCIKQGDLKITIKNNRIYLSGEWKDTKKECTPGTIEISKPYKKIENGRPVTLSGKITDQQTKRIVNAKLSLYEDDRLIKEFKNETKSGAYQTIIKPKNKKYLIQITASGYFPFQEIISIPENTLNIPNNFELSPLETGVKITLKNVLFVQGEDTFLDEAYAELNNLVSILKDNHNIRIRLEGHTDYIGKLEDNQKLSEDRVIKIKKYLIQNSIDENRIETKAFGGSMPLKTNGTDEERKINRRVEFVLLEK